MYEDWTADTQGLPQFLRSLAGASFTQSSRSSLPPQVPVFACAATQPTAERCDSLRCAQPYCWPHQLFPCRSDFVKLGVLFNKARPLCGDLFKEELGIGKEVGVFSLQVSCCHQAVFRLDFNTGSRLTVRSPASAQTRRFVFVPNRK